MIAIDYSKAFDSVSHSTIFKLFETFGSGDKIINWTKTLYNNGRSCVMNNDFKSDYFSIERSCRQGDNLSPYCFILVLEILLNVLRSDENIQGIKIENRAGENGTEQEVKLSSFADDCTYFLRNKDSIGHLLQHIRNFSLISGLEINRSKSECLYIGGEIDPGEDNILGIPLVENLKILGYYFGHSKLICEYQNFFSRLVKIEKLFNIWKQRTLTIFGKNLIINSLATSLVIFPAHVDHPPEAFLRELKKLIKNFLWSSNNPKIAHSAAISDWKNGGFKFRDLDNFLEGLKIKFLTKLDFYEPKSWVASNQMDM